MRSCRAQTACRCTNTRARVGLAPVQRVTAPRADARSVRNHRDRHTCHIPVGPLLRGLGERCAKRVRQTPTHPQQRPCPPFRRTGNTLWNNKSHDHRGHVLLLQEARSACVIQNATTAPHRTCAVTRESSEGRKNAGARSGQDECRIGTVARTHLALTSSRPGHTEVSSQSPHEEASAPGACGVSCLHWAPRSSNRYAPSRVARRKDTASTQQDSSVSER